MTRRGIVLFALMSVIWGIPYLFIRIAVGEITPAMLVFARTAIAAAILLPIAIIRVDLRAILVRWRWVVAFAAVEIAVPWVMVGSAEQRVSSSLTALLVAGVPLVGAGFALATGGADRTSRTGLAGLLIGLLGVVAIVGADFQADDAVALVQIGIVVIGYAVGPAILARRLGGLPAVGVMALSLGLVALVYLPIAIVQWPTVMPSTDVLWSIGILAVDLHCGGIPDLRRLDRRDRSGPLDGDHVHQPGRGGDPRRVRAERDVHARDGDRVRAGNRRLGPGDAPDATSPGAGSGRHPRGRAPGLSRWEGRCSGPPG